MGAHERQIDWPAEIRKRELEAANDTQPGKLIVVDLWGIPRQAIDDYHTPRDRKTMKAWDQALDLEREAKKLFRLALMCEDKGQHDNADTIRKKANQLVDQATELRKT